ncbi:MAG: LPS O-antigen length regulator, partial [Pararheinheimera sp.]|nr:LPS O-antigen length regulator [Rheinheimera sp.]
TNISDIRVQLFSLVEEQMQKLMIANVRDEYVFKTVDQAIVPEEKAKPKRALMVILAAMFGFILSVILVLVRYFFSKK